jgi:hypothetical protein
VEVAFHQRKNNFHYVVKEQCCVGIGVCICAHMVVVLLLNLCFSVPVWLAYFSSSCVLVLLHGMAVQSVHKTSGSDTSIF